MPRIKRTNTPDEFDATSIKARELHETNDCAVKAVAIVTGEPYEKVHNLMWKLGRKPRDGTSFHIIIATLRLLGWEVECQHRSKLYREGGLMREMINSYPKPHNNLKKVTTHHPRRFPKQWEGFPDCILGTDGHVLAFKDGEVKDWSINKSLRVIDIITIKKKGN